jgi:hypothetical protein
MVAEGKEQRKVAASVVRFDILTTVTTKSGVV